MKKPKFSIPPRYVLFLLTVLCVILLGINFVFPTALNPVRQGIFTLFMPMQKGINQIGASIADEIESFLHMREAEEENQLLRQENAALQEKLDRYALDYQELQELRALLGLKNTYEQYPSVAANVIQKESGNWFNSFVIDKGSDDGIKVDMNVLSGGGLCGIVTEVGKNYAKVLAIIDDDSNISAMSATSKDSFIVAGDLQLYGEGLLNIQYADKDAVLAKGDMVITSNISTKYLPGLLIGYIQEISLDANNLTQSGYLLPTADFDDLTQVLVIRMVKDDLMIDETETKPEESSEAEPQTEIPGGTEAQG
ncbi:MAG: rod shape-determining protein MreC [Lachnospiraceae bacterium]|nr:rod shape-determining protein MreC [Lachnospiraceae bacterium]